MGWVGMWGVNENKMNSGRGSAASRPHGPISFDCSSSRALKIPPSFLIIQQLTWHMPAHTSPHPARGWVLKSWSSATNCVGHGSGLSNPLRGGLCSWGVCLCVMWGARVLAHKYLYIYICVFVGKPWSFYLGIHSVIHLFVHLLFMEDLLCVATMSNAIMQHSLKQTKFLPIQSFFSYFLCVI